ncbi:hypothetical protein GW17_00046889 [Ensete ventricosum]|nr:hypothetical protein GW17_00046889 [Ensete ventricosum]
MKVKKGKNQGLQFRYLPPGTGGTYWSARFPVRRPPATGRFRQKSTVNGRLKGEIHRRWSIEEEIDRRRSIERGKWRKKKKRKKKKKKEKRKKIYRPRMVLIRAPSPPASHRRSFSRAGRKIEATKVCNTDGYHPYRAVHTGPPVDRNADHPLTGGTVNCGCFYPVTIRNRPVMVESTVDGRFRAISTEGEKRRGRRKGRTWSQH